MLVGSEENLVLLQSRVGRAGGEAEASGDLSYHLHEPRELF